VIPQAFPIFLPVDRRQRTGGLAQPVFPGNSCLPSKGGLSLFRVLWVEGGARRRLRLYHQTPVGRGSIWNSHKHRTI
jgi:hypothetical protein